jgi:hypothetical protein
VGREEEKVGVRKGERKKRIKSEGGGNEGEGTGCRGTPFCAVSEFTVLFYKISARRSSTSHPSLTCV